MKISELIARLAEEIIENGDQELGENFIVCLEYGRIKYY